MEKVNIMPDIVGQKNLKKIFNFHLKPYKKNGVFPTTLLNASMGEGKTMVLKSLSQELGKAATIINCASVKNANVFVTDVYTRFMDPSSEYTIVADEFQVLDKPTQSLLLTLLTPNKEMYNETVHNINGVPLTLKFNLRRHTFLAATTNIENLLQPLVDRFRVYSMDKYSPNDLKEILNKNLEDIEVPNSVMKDILRYIRVNPRSCVMFASDIRQGCLGADKKVFGKEMWEELKDVLNLRLYGLDSLEEKTLEILFSHVSGVRLTYLASALRLDNKSVQRIERYLSYHDLMQNMDGKRFITEKGKAYFNV